MFIILIEISYGGYMKRRKGFVANSSSSSFLVIFERKPKSVEEVREYLFPDKKWSDSFYAYDYETNIAAIVETVFLDTREQNGVNLKGIKEEFGSGWNEFEENANPEDISKYHDLEREEDSLSNKHWREYHRIREALEIKVGKSIPDENSPEYIKWNSSKDKESKKKIALLNELKEEDKKYWAENHRIYNERDKLREKMAAKSGKVFYDKYKDKWIGRFSYSDNDGSFGVIMEHGGIFDNVEHVRFSHH